MRLAYFINHYPVPSHSFIRREILALEARGHRVLRYALDAPKLVDPDDIAEEQRTAHIFRKSGFELVAAALMTLAFRPFRLMGAIGTMLRLGWRSHRGLARHFAYFAEAAIIARWCARDGAEHIHAHFGTNSAAVALLASRMNGIPFSFTAHGPDEFDRPETLGLPEKIRQARFVVAVCSYGRAQLMRWADAPQWSKISVVHCGLDEAFRLEPRCGAAPVGGRFICVGRLADQKGHLLLLEAAHILRTSGCSFELVLGGDGPLREQIERRIVELGLEGNVSITGWIGGAQVRREIKRARVMVLPSLAEGLPVALMEAMALQRPVIATYVAGIPELVRAGDTGWLVPAADVDALAEAMRAALDSSPEEITRMGAAARCRVLEQHDISREVQKLEMLLSGASHGRRLFNCPSPPSDGPSAARSFSDDGGGRRSTVATSRTALLG